MTLNFPSDQTVPYVDSDTGLKYIYNFAIGAWETAVQPPCIISDTPPSLELPGFFWWDSLNGNLFVRYDDGNSAQWVQTIASGARYITTFSATAPTTASVGDIWIDASQDQPALKVRLIKDGEEYWRNLERALVQNPYDGPKIKVLPSAPTDASIADVYYNTTDQKIYVYTQDGWKNPGQFDGNIGLRSISVGDGLLNTGGDKPTISLRQATQTETGIVRLANQTEASGTTDHTVALSPARLKSTIDKYLPTATTSTSGVIRLATSEEVEDSTNTSVAITPKTLAESSYAVPAGVVFQFMGTQAPNGYLIADGREVSRVQYSELYNMIGHTYGIGDGYTTFNLPNVKYFTTESQPTVNSIIKY